MKISEKGLALIVDFEGLRLRSYQDPVGIWTIGYGHTGSGVKPGMRISSERAEELLRRDAAKFEAGVEDMLRRPVTQGQFDALASLAYNVGLDNLRKSMLLGYVNDMDFAAAASQFPKWNRAGGMVLAGLTRRRAAEKARFLEVEP